MWPDNRLAIPPEGIAGLKRGRIMDIHEQAKLQYRGKKMLKNEWTKTLQKLQNTIAAQKKEIESLQKERTLLVKKIFELKTRIFNLSKKYAHMCIMKLEESTRREEEI
jgi:uncharacterized UPF0160 family protein